jgi:pSer/pThr/pTyr-binding forkhead associated (FHA) protein
MTVRLRLLAPDGVTVRDFSVDTFPARVGRDPAAEFPFGEKTFRMVSGAHAEIGRIAAGFVLIPRSQKNPTLPIGRPVGEPRLLRAGDRIGLGHTGPTVLVVSAEDGTGR